MNRARRTFWLLVVAATAAMGTLSRAAEASPRPIAGLAVAVSAIVLAVSIALAARIAARLDGTGE